MPALIARRGDADFARREFVSKTEETSVRAGVGAKAFLPQKINSDKTANKRNGIARRPAAHRPGAATEKASDEDPFF